MCRLAGDELVGHLLLVHGLHPEPAGTRATTVVVPSFEGTTTVGLPVPCPCDTELAVTKYLRAAPDGEVPLDFLFSGTVFFDGGRGRLTLGTLDDAVRALPDRAEGLCARSPAASGSPGVPSTSEAPETTGAPWTT
ncbi:DUF6084 family protein [Streptomyces sp. CNQ085]|uniref:DUF6084 family protein n=1 Tax=Streptomyces sp. CNQ085 TaxID=2886944 RepID=UPI001F504B6B|nr:DUF6084 family protein [Streptomyces sp. CNQ085]MCI0383070.1 DUF6084 family protein [Streptomyces sp. CNQ085]